MPPHCYLHHRLNYKSSASGPHQYDTCHRAHFQASDAWSADPERSNNSSTSRNSPRHMPGQNCTEESQSAQEQAQSVATQSCTPDEPLDDKDRNTQLDISQIPQTSAQQSEPISAAQQASPPQQETQASLQPSRNIGGPPQVSRLCVGQPDTAVNKEAVKASAANSGKISSAEGRNTLTMSRQSGEKLDNLLDPPIVTDTVEWILCNSVAGSCVSVQADCFSITHF